jgi:hypothetical protein
MKKKKEDMADSLIATHSATAGFVLCANEISRSPALAVLSGRNGCIQTRDIETLILYHIALEALSPSGLAG